MYGYSDVKEYLFNTFEKEFADNNLVFIKKILGILETFGVAQEHVEKPHSVVPT